MYSRIYIYSPKLNKLTKQNKIYNRLLFVNTAFIQNILYSMNIPQHTLYPTTDMRCFFTLRIFSTANNICWQVHYMAACFSLTVFPEFLVRISPWFAFLASLLSSLFHFLRAVLILFFSWLGAVKSVNMPFN